MTWQALCVSPVGGWEGHVPLVAIGSERSHRRSYTCFGLVSTVVSTVAGVGSPALLGDSTQKSHGSPSNLLSGIHCTQLLAPGRGSPAFPISD